MDDKKSTKLTRLIVILPLLGIAITSFALVQIFLSYEQSIYDADIEKVRQDIVKKSKVRAYEKIMDISNYIVTTTDILKKQARVEVKSMTTFAVNMIDLIYKNNKDLPKDKIIELVKQHFRDVRFFDNKTGYYDIFDIKGNSVLLPTLPSKENINLLYFKDARGQYPIKDSIKIVKNSNEGYYEWYWYKPDSLDMKKKIGYVKGYKKLGIYIVTARYEEDIISSIKPKMQKLLMNIKHEDRGYIFAFDYDGMVIANRDKKLIGTNIWNKATKNEYIAKNIIKGARVQPEGFFMTYITSFDKELGESEYKTSFIKDVPELGWVIGTGAYYNDLLKEIKEKRRTLKEKLESVVDNISYATALVLAIMLIVTLIVSYKLQSILKTYQKHLVIKHRQTMAQKEQLVYQLEHDYLTNLPNRIMLINRLNQAISLSKRDGREIAIFFIDVDNFKVINDTMGHDSGDIILKEVARRLQGSIRESDLAARFGGDEFVVVVENYKNIRDIIKIIDNIQKNINKPILIGESSYSTTLSLGVSIYPTDGEDPNTLLKNADIAMYQAKTGGRDAYRFFTNRMNEEIITKIKMEDSLRLACMNQEFVLHYQPVVNAIDSKIVSVEALIRWNHPTKGLIFPDQFISLAEESGIIIDIGKWVIDESMKQIVQWKSKGYDIEKIAVNVAAYQLDNSDLIEYIKDALERNLCKPEWIEVEVIERYIMKNLDKSISILNRLRLMGIDVSIDDFGTGHSSLAYLKELPVTKLKIDRAFVKNIEGSFEDRAIAKTIIALGNGLLMKVLAEGVETDMQKGFLTAQGCSLMQGYLFSKPLPLVEVDELIKRGYCG